MKKIYFGDSYDIVKRFFIQHIQELGYEIIIDAMDNGIKTYYANYVKLLGIKNNYRKNKCVFFDPDVGIKNNNKSTHISFETILIELDSNDLVACFDQSFSRQKSYNKEIQSKLEYFSKYGINGLYYSSHAKIFIGSKSKKPINQIKNKLIKNGIPKERIISKESSI